MGVLDEDIKTKWIEALRSGKYKQGRHNLRTSSGRYCCLGVLCDLVDPEGWSDTVDAPVFHNTDDTPVYLHRGLRGTLSVRIMDMVQVEEGDYLSSDWPVILALLNDDGKSFGQIADYIEGEL